MAEGFPARLCLLLVSVRSRLVRLLGAGRGDRFEEGIESSPSLSWSCAGGVVLAAAGWPAGRPWRSCPFSSPPPHPTPLPPFPRYVPMYSAGLRLSSCTLQAMEWNAQGRSSRALLCLPGPQDQFKSRAGPGRDLRAGVKTMGRSPSHLIFNFWMQYYLHNGLSVPHSSSIEKNQYFT